ncbi:MAG: ubiquinol-cytochrome c reductase iron-sulfur subunit [Thermoanaerobaculia bacterium]|nr:ubiquinol-cytochrome c reductase iron-sulfur subunit [Thermoanaerobaculia bacterium]
MTTTSKSSRLDPEPMPRRDFLGLAAMWAMGASAAFALLGILRLPRAAVLPAPSKKFKVALPESLADGEPFVPPGRSVALFKDKDGVYAVSTICTHLGCIVKQSADGFACPCHGSEFHKDGTVKKGPAPTALPWLAVTKDGGSFVVDESKVVDPGTRLT